VAKAYTDFAVNKTTLMMTPTPNSIQLLGGCVISQAKLTVMNCAPLTSSGFFMGVFFLLFDKCLETTFDPTHPLTQDFFELGYLKSSYDTFDDQ
jgi:hypothetical protein